MSWPLPLAFEIVLLDCMNIAILSLILAACVFGFSGILVKQLNMSPMAIAGFRLVVPAVMLLCFYPQLRKLLSRKPSKTLLVTSTLTAFRIGLWVLAFLYAPVSKVVVILFTWPIFFALLAHWFLNESLSKRGWTLMLIALCGVVIFCLDTTGSDSGNYLLGMGLMFSVAIINAGVLVVLKQKSNEYSSTQILLYDNLVGSVIYLPFILFALPQMTQFDFGFGLFYGFLIGFVAYRLLYFALPKVKASVWGVISYLEVITAAIMSVLLLGETITGQMFVGAVLILIPIMLIRYVK